MADKKSFIGIITFFLTLCFITSSFAISLEDKPSVDEIDTHIKNVTKADKLEKQILKDYVKDINQNEYVNYDIDTEKTKIKLKNIKNPKNIKQIKISKNNKIGAGSDIINITDITLDYAEIILEKYYPNFPITLLHAEDGQDWQEVNSSVNQNSTHFWFTTNEFSSWTAIPNILYFYLFGETLDFPLHNYFVQSGIESEDVQLYFSLSPTDSTGEVRCWYGTTCYSDDDFTKNSGNDNMYVLSLTTLASGTENLFMSINDVASPATTGFTNTVEARIINHATSALIDTDSFTVSYITNFIVPDVDYVSSSSVTETTATINSEVDEQDLLYYSQYTNLENKRGLKVRVMYSDDDFSTAFFTSFVSVADSIDFQIPLSGLTENTEYKAKIQIEYYDAETNQDEIVSSVDTTTFTTLSSGGNPSVQTISASTTSTSAYFKALVNYDGYTGGDLGLHWYYKRVIDSTWIPIPTSGFIVPNDGSVTTSQEVTGLTTGTEYHYYSEIVWNSGSESAIGSTISFTPSDPIDGIDTSDIVLYYSFDDDANSEVAVDESVNNYDGTIYEALFQTGKLNLGIDTDGSDDYIYTPDNNDLSFTDGAGNDDPFSVCFWMEADSASATASLFGKFSSQYEYDVLLNTNQEIQVQIYSQGSSSAYLQKYSTVTISLNTFTHICMIYDGTNSANGITFYIDGSSDSGTDTSVGSYAGMINTNANVNYGARDGASLFYNGMLDEIIITDDVLTGSEIDYLYNNGDGQNPYESQLTNSTVQTLSATLVSSTSATMNLISDFGDYSPVGGYFEYKENSSSTWIERPLSPASLTNNTIYSYTLQDLTPNTLYDFRGVISYDGGTLVFGDILQFTTDTLTLPNIEVRGTIASDLSATLRGEVLDFGDYEGQFEVLWRYKKKTDPTYSGDVGLTPASTLGIYTHEISFLDSETAYESCFFGLINSTTYFQGFCLDFNTTAEGQPIIETQTATDITRTSAQLNGEILDLGTFDNVTCSFDYWNQGNSSNKLSTPELPYFVEVGIGDTVDNLFINTTYFYELLCHNTERGYSNSGGLLSFDTLSTADVIPPELTLVLNNTGSDFIELTGLIDNIDQFNVTYYFSLQDYDKVAISGSPLVSSNESFVFDTYTFSNINLNDTMNGIFYVKMYGTYVYNETQQFIESSYIRVNLQEVIEGGDFELLPGWTLYIGDPLFFSFMFLILVPICGIGLCIAYGSTAEADKNINRFLSWGLVATLLVVLVWFSVVGLIPTWQSTISITILAILGVYYIVKGRRGAY